MEPRPFIRHYFLETRTLGFRVLSSGGHPP
jgi:hypothetical protein